MKNLFLIIVIGLFCSANISAQSNEFEVKRIDNKIVLVKKTFKSEKLGDLKVSPELLKKYGDEKILKAWKICNLEVNGKTSLTYNFYGTKKKKTTTKTFLQRNGNEIVEKTETKAGEWLPAYETFLFWILASVGFMFINQLKKIKNLEIFDKDFFTAIIIAVIFGISIGFVSIFYLTIALNVIFCFVAFFIMVVSIMSNANASAIFGMVIIIACAIGLFIAIGIMGQWVPLKIFISILFFSILCGYIYTRKKIILKK
ncbi:MAG: hypothetical protein WC872_00920 [Candidatus Absconditabacterales bacterium]|jgi:hypothetical protein